MISKANKLIEDAFKDKFDKGGEPYIYHLNRVARKFEGVDNIVVSLLHDLLEDCPEWTEQRLRLEFPGKIVDAVVCLTKIKGESYLDYLNRVKSNEIALKVKISDLEDNMDIKRLNHLTDKDCERLKKYHRAWVELTQLV